MPRREQDGGNNSSTPANMVYKVRISKGFVDSNYGDGFLVEVWDFRTQRLVYGERFKELEAARMRQQEIKSELESMSLDRFKQAYVSRARRQ